MSDHPIDNLMQTAMNSIKEMIDVNTIVGNPIETAKGIVIIPISKVSFGFAAGGSEFKCETINDYKKVNGDEEVQYRLPFGGGSGAGVSISPIGFVVINGDTVKISPMDHFSSVDKLIDYIPDVMQKVTSFLEDSNNKCKKEESN